MKSTPNNIRRFINLTKRNTTHRCYEEIHVETIVNIEVFDSLLAYVKKHPKTMLMLTGWNEPWIKARVQADFLTDKEYTDILTERYTKLGNATRNIGLHTHLFHPKTIKVPTFKQQFDKIISNLEFIKSLGFCINDFAPGWYGYNYDSVKACCLAGIKRFHCKVALPTKEVEFVKIFRSCDDFEL